MSVWSWIKGWHLERVFTSIKNNADKVAIAITEAVKTALNSGVVDFIVRIVDNALPQLHDLPATVVAKIREVIPKVLAAELALQGLPDSPTADDILKFEQNILTAFGVHDQKSKLYTTLAAQIYDIIKTDVDAGTKLTFAELVKDVDQAYQDYLKDKADAAA